MIVNTNVDDMGTASHARRRLLARKTPFSKPERRSPMEIAKVLSY
jgi:hypothetical protein